jgi:hypothetical protein
LRSSFLDGVALGGALLFLPLAAAASSGDAGARPASEAAFSLGLPGKPWRLWVQLPGFEMEPVQQRPGSARALGVVESQGLTVSLTLATSPEDPSPKSCRDHDWAGRQKGTPVREDTQLSAEKDTARVDFLVPGTDGQSREKHVLLYLQRDGVCAVVHLSQLRYQPKDAEGLERLLATVRLGG